MHGRRESGGSEHAPKALAKTLTNTGKEKRRLPPRSALWHFCKVRKVRETSRQSEDTLKGCFLHISCSVALVFTHERTACTAAEKSNPVFMYTEPRVPKPRNNSNNNSLHSPRAVSQQIIEIGKVLPLGKKRQDQAESPRKKSSSPAAGWPLLCGRTVLCASAAAAMRLRSPSARFGLEYVNTYGACFALAAAADKVCAAGTAASQIALTIGFLLLLASCAGQVRPKTSFAAACKLGGPCYALCGGDRGCLTHARAARHALCGGPVCQSFNHFPLHWDTGN